MTSTPVARAALRQTGARRVPDQEAAERTEQQMAADNPVLRMGTPVDCAYFMCAPPT
ncbi:hypothetical protein SUDANB9_00079 [Streptomyces sp. enrichment culture]